MHRIWDWLWDRSGKKGVKDYVKLLAHNMSTCGNADFEVLINNPSRKRS